MKINESNNMLNKKIFEELSQSQLIKLLLEKNVKPDRPQDQFQHHEKVSNRWCKNIKIILFLNAPIEFRDGWKPTPKPRTIKNVVPVTASRTKIEEKSKALKGYTKSFKITIRNDTDPLGKTWKRKQEKQLNTD